MKQEEENTQREREIISEILTDRVADDGSSHDIDLGRKLKRKKDMDDKEKDQEEKDQEEEDQEEDTSTWPKLCSKCDSPGASYISDNGTAGMLCKKCAYPSANILAFKEEEKISITLTLTELERIVLMLRGRKDPDRFLNVRLENILFRVKTPFVKCHHCKSEIPVNLAFREKATKKLKKELRRKGNSVFFFCSKEHDEKFAEKMRERFEKLFKEYFKI